MVIRTRASFVAISFRTPSTRHNNEGGRKLYSKLLSLVQKRKWSKKALSVDHALYERTVFTTVVVPIQLRTTFERQVGSRWIVNVDRTVKDDNVLPPPSSWTSSYMEWQIIGAPWPKRGKGTQRTVDSLRRPYGGTTGRAGAEGMKWWAYRGSAINTPHLGNHPSSRVNGHWGNYNLVR